MRNLFLHERPVTEAHRLEPPAEDPQVVPVDGNVQTLRVGTGNLDLPKLMTVLKQSNFTGPLVIEYEGDVENPVPALKKCVEALKKLM